jgi:hypothetical protein
MSCSFFSLSTKEIQTLFEKWTPSDSKSYSETTKVTYSPKPYSEWNPYVFEQIQTYNPLYSKIFIPTPNQPHTSIEHSILPSYYRFHDLKSVIVSSEPNTKPHTKHMFIKFSPLLDPLRYLTGKYGGFTIDNPELKQLPTLENASLFSTFSTINKDPPLQKGLRKLYDPNTASYVDGFFYYLSSNLLHHHHLENGIDFYGSFLAIQKHFRMNVYDDITYLRRYSYFNNNREKIYHIYDQTFLKYLEFEKSKGHQERNSRKHHKVRLEISSLSDVSEGGGAIDIMELLGVEDLTPPSLPTSDIISQPLSEEESPETLDMNAPFFSSSFLVSSNTQTSSQKSSSLSESEDDDSEPADLSEDSESDSSESECPPVDDEENETLYAYINDFPVQMICMETCEGTLDQLFVHQILNPTNYDTEGASMMFQVVATLIAYQKAYHFTHNDLHTNNIMWVSTPIEYLYYQIQGRTYRVPTYNRIYKIIDFGRAIYEFQGQRFCSDSFASPEGDAATQYNCEPYIIPEKPVIEPNPSFDLCRLACAIYDFLMDDDSDVEDEEPEDAEQNEDEDEDEEEDAEQDEDEDEEEDEGDSVWEDDDSTEEIPDTLFSKLIMEWCEDDKGKNMLYKNKKSGKERYPYFKLYQMIARTVHRHIPLNQIHNPLFTPFLLPEGASLKKKKSDVSINLDAIPDYSK